MYPLQRKRDISYRTTDSMREGGVLTRYGRSSKHVRVLFAPRLVGQPFCFPRTVRGSARMSVASIGKVRDVPVL